jgi:integrase
VAKKPLAPRSVSHALTLLWSASRWAIRHDRAWRTVADALDAATAPRSQALDERSSPFLRSRRRYALGPFRVELGSAMRRGEILALRWDDVMLPEM